MYYPHSPESKWSSFLSEAKWNENSLWIHSHCLGNYTTCLVDQIEKLILFFLCGLEFLNWVSVVQELQDQHNFLHQSCISAFEHGKREIGKLITMILICIQISSPLPLLNWDFQSIHPAMAVLYSPDTKVPRTGELALRRAIPANTSMKAIQVADILVNIHFFLDGDH